MGQAGKGLDHTNPRLTRQQQACLGNRGSLSAPFSGDPAAAAARPKAGDGLSVPGGSRALSPGILSPLPSRLPQARTRGAPAPPKLFVSQHLLGFSLPPEAPCRFLPRCPIPHEKLPSCSSPFPQMNTVLRVCLEAQHRKRTDPKWQVSSQLKFSNKHPILKTAFNSREKPAGSAPSSPPNYSSHPIPTETSRNTNAW